MAEGPGRPSAGFIADRLGRSPDAGEYGQHLLKRLALIDQPSLVGKVPELAGVGLIDNRKRLSFCVRSKPQLKAVRRGLRRQMLQREIGMGRLNALSCSL